MSSSQNRQSGSQTVTRALKLLECFTSEHPELTLTELSNITGLTVPTTHRLLKTLIAQRFLVLDTASKHYRLGPAVMQLAGAIINRDDLHNVVVPYLERLRRESGETVGFHLLVDSERVCIIELESRQRIRMSSGVGRRYSLHRGAAGKALLAALPPEERTSYLDRVLSGEPSFPARDLEAELAQVNREGVAFSVGEVVDGACAVAAPVLDSSGYPIAAVNVTGPASRWTRTEIDKIVPDLRELTAEISVQLGHTYHA